jgi:hypothetical protein
MSIINSIMGQVVQEKVGGILDGITGSILDRQRFLQVWRTAGYDVNNPAFQKWLFGKDRFGDVKRAGALTVDLMNNHPVILAEAAQWKTLPPAGANANATGSTGHKLPPTYNPATAGSLGLVIVIAILGWIAKSKLL